MVRQAGSLVIGVIIAVLGILLLPVGIQHLQQFRPRRIILPQNSLQQRKQQIHVFDVIHAMAVPHNCDYENHAAPRFISWEPIRHLNFDEFVNFRIIERCGLFRYPAFELPPSGRFTRRGPHHSSTGRVRCCRRFVYHKGHMFGLRALLDDYVIGSKFRCCA